MEGTSRCIQYISSQPRRAAELSGPPTSPGRWVYAKLPQSGRGPGSRVHSEYCFSPLRLSLRGTGMWLRDGHSHKVGTSHPSPSNPRRNPAASELVVDTKQITHPPPPAPGWDWRLRGTVTKRDPEPSRGASRHGAPPANTAAEEIGSSWEGPAPLRHPGAHVI